MGKQLRQMLREGMSNILSLQPKAVDGKNLHQYLSQELEEGKIDFAFRASPNPDGTISFYVHPADRDGDTRDYIVSPDGTLRNGLWNQRQAK